tara:strand:- start:218 stop:1318 length:1101 start_codon:yes stop_codon:yes gene_type:complete
MPLGANKAVLMGSSAGAGGNYFGDGSDGSVTTSGNVTYTVANKNGSYDGDMYVANYQNFTVSVGHTVTVDQPCRGLLLYVDGDLVVNGSLSMASMGACADPTASGGSDSSAVSATGIRLPMLTASGTDTLAAADFAGCGNGAVAAVANQAAVAGDGTIFTTSKAGASGGGSAHCQSWGPVRAAVGGAGTTGGATLSTGGGTGGACWGGGYFGGCTTGVGGDGGAFSGGSGGGGGTEDNCNCGGGGAGADYGCAGGAGSSCAGCSSAGGGNGTGGQMWVVCSGDVTVASGGSITAQGSEGVPAGPCPITGTGGGTGGGTIHILHGGTYTNSGTVAAAGGAGGAAGNPNGTSGREGGAGGVFNQQVES